MRSRHAVLLAWTAFLGFAFSAPARAADFNVPSIAYPTLQDAVSAAAVSPDKDNFINIVSSPLAVHAGVEFGVAFGPNRHVVVRPGTTLSRAAIVSDDPGNPIIRMVGLGGGFVTLRDLDILRNITNNHHLIVISEYSDVVIERCRVGSVWSVPGGTGWNNLEIVYPYNVLVRNSIFFAYAPGTFDRGIHAFSFIDPDNALRLYNNVVADYRLCGIDIQATTAGSLVLLRNNVTANHPAFIGLAEAYGYRADITADPTVVASHNVAFATAGHDQVVAAVQSIEGSYFLPLPQMAVDPSFVERAWIGLPGNPNPNFFRLEPLGPLHDQSGDWGVNVGNGIPDANDVAVVDDLERQWRPGGTPLHTDRGADQIESGASAVGTPMAGRALWAAPRRNPARDVEVLFQADRAGRLRFEAFDLAGRRLRVENRVVVAGERGAFQMTRVSPGLVHYRLTLVDAGHSSTSVAGSLAVIR